MHNTLGKWLRFRYSQMIPLLAGWRLKFLSAEDDRSIAAAQATIDEMFPQKKSDRG